VIWNLEWTSRALKDVRKLDPSHRGRIVAALERYARSGEGDIVQLSGIDPPEHRLRVGDWRIRFQRDPTRTVLLILRVLPRDKVYRTE